MDFWELPILRRLHPPLYTPTKKGLFWAWRLNASDGETQGEKQKINYIIAITPRSTRTQNGSTCQGPIYGSNKFIF